VARRNIGSEGAATAFRVSIGSSSAEQALSDGRFMLSGIGLQGSSKVRRVREIHAGSFE
jgi:hypothetical protein